MVKRWCFACSFVLLIAALVFPLGGTAAAAPLAGAFTTGTDTSGHHYGFFSLTAPATVTSVTTTFAAGTASASIQCDVAAPNSHHGAGNANDPSEWQSVWSLSNPVGSMTVGATCTTQWVRVDVGNATPPTAMSVSGTAVTGTPTATTAIPTATMVMPTATMTGHGGGTCTGYGDHAVDQHGVSVDAWAPGLRTACGFAGYENGDNPMPAGTPFPAPRPFRSIDGMEPVFGFKVFYLGADTATKCDDMRLIFHQGDAPGGRHVRYHSMQYAIAHCDANGNYLGYTDVAAFADTGGTLDVDPSRPNGDNGQRPMKLVPTLADIKQYGVFEVWYADFFIYDPRLSTSGQPTNKGFPIVTVRPGIDIHNVGTYLNDVNDTGLHYTCGVLGGGQPGDAGCQYDGAKRGLSHPGVDIYPVGHVAGYPQGFAATTFCTDLYGGFDGPCAIQQHVFQGSLYRTTCQADGGVGTLPNCYPEFVRGPNSPGANQAKTSPYQSPGPATYFVPGLRYPN
jgi:hypothetical protein